MSQVRVAKGIPNQSLLKQTRFSNSLAKQKIQKHISGQKKTKIQLNISKTKFDCALQITAELLEASTLTCDRDEISSGGKHWFQRLGTSSSSNLEHVLPRLGSIGSLVWELLVPRTGSPWFQDWEALVRTFGNQLFELRKIGKHSFERLGTASS